MMKGDSEKNFQKFVAQTIVNICQINEQLYIPTIRQILKALRITFAQEDIFHCHYSSYFLLEIVNFQI